MLCIADEHIKFQVAPIFSVLLELNNNNNNNNNNIINTKACGFLNAIYDSLSPPLRSHASEDTLTKI